ncbi:MAG: hypothetical protein NZ551_11805 [Microscillaceae bacterium]|nr:hypothetical protein [Microscillaceae bacterium]MDW8461879.1 hypothetical protein [Cytophagales bacterium]
MNGGAGQTYYIGIKNPDSMYGISVAINVVAIVLEEEWGTREVRKANIKSREVMFLKD